MSDEVKFYLDPVTKRHRLFLPHDLHRPMIEADEGFDWDGFLEYVAKKRAEFDAQRTDVPTSARR